MERTHVRCYTVWVCLVARAHRLSKNIFPPFPPILRHTIGMPESTLLQLTGVTKRYAAAGNANGVNVLAGITLAVARGDSLAIVGPSGSGKSTLLQIIGTLDRPSEGEVLLAGKNLAALNDLELAQVRNQQIGFVFQSH